ncbi:MAG: retron system putative HNH endonuclease [Planctomycetia bacterium]
MSATTKEERGRWIDKYRHRQVKDALVDIFHGKCAYCESRILHVDYGHIEHFRPKAGPKGRLDLTFTWTNLLLACGVCNGGGNKSDHFPDVEDGGPIVDPCDDDPAQHFEFRYDDAIGLASVYGSTVRGEQTEKILGLNRQHLRAHRSEFVKKLSVLAHFAATNQQAAELLAAAKSAGGEYAAFARTIS